LYQINLSCNALSKVANGHKINFKIKMCGRVLCSIGKKNIFENKKPKKNCRETEINDNREKKRENVVLGISVNNSMTMTTLLSGFFCVY
jgi:hypothetical protein